MLSTSLRQQHSIPAMRVFLAILIFSSLRVLFSQEWGSDHHMPEAEETDLQATVLDPLLEQSSFSADGFQLRPGRWEFPGSCWTVSTKLTSQPPEPALISEVELFESEAANLRTDAEKAQHCLLDEQLMVLIHSAMSPTYSRGTTVVYGHVASGLRSAAISRKEDGREIPVKVWLQWPASGGQWTELLLQRSASVEVLPPLVALPVGSTVIAQRRCTNEQIQYQAAEVPSAPKELHQFLEQSGFRIEPDTLAPGCFRAASKSGIYEFLWRELDVDRISVLVRQI